MDRTNTEHVAEEAHTETNETIEGVSPEILPNTIWAHHSGRFYEVISLTNRPNTEAYPLTIIYKSFQGEPNQTWSGSPSDWYRRMSRIWPIRMTARLAWLADAPDLNAWNRFHVRRPDALSQQPGIIPSDFHTNA